MRWLILLAVLLTGCQKAPRVVVQRVEVPVAVPCPEPALPPRPELPLVYITSASTPEQVVRAYLVSIEILKGYALELEILLRGYKRP